MCIFTDSETYAIHGYCIEHIYVYLFLCVTDIEG